MKTLDHHEVVRVENNANIGNNTGLIISIALGLMALFGWLWKVFRGVATESWVKEEFAELKDVLKKDMDGLDGRVHHVEIATSDTKRDIAVVKTTMAHTKESVERIHTKLDLMSASQNRSGTDVKRLISEAIREHNPQK